MAAASANPPYVAAVGIGKFVTKTIADQWRKNQDDMIGILYTSPDGHEHYPYAERKRDNLPDLTNNVLVDYLIFGFKSPEQASLRRLRPVSGKLRPRRVA